MKFYILLSLSLFTQFSFAKGQPYYKVCTVLHENKSSQCLTAEKQSFPTTKLFGISRLPKGQPPSQVIHTWNGAQATEVTSLESGRIIISSFVVPVGHAGTVSFVVKNSSDIILITKTIEVARGPLSISAHEIDSQISAPAPVVVVAKAPPYHDDVLQPLDAFNSEDTTPLPPAHDNSEEVLTETHRAVEHRTRTVKGSPKKRKHDSLGLIWKRIEIHGAFITQSVKGSSYTVLPYYAPEIRTSSFLGAGARVGGTEFKAADGKNIRAFEGDLHLSLNFKTSKGLFSLQPAYGYHSWSKFGTNSSYGGVVEIKLDSIPLSILGSAQFWTYKKIDYRLATIGLGVEF